MLLKVGELAKRAGLTVRTLHHYDAIGLLTPSARSDAGYRLYNLDDVARLHAIQVLRQIGMSLENIAAVLAEQGGSPEQVVQRQILELDHQIAQAKELRTRLSLLQTRMANGVAPDMAEWLGVLERMSTYRKYFTDAELKKLFANANAIHPEWQPLLAQARCAMDRGIDPESLELQPLIRKWMVLGKRWVGGDYELMARWDAMFEREPGARGNFGMNLDMHRFMQRAVQVRLKALHRHFSPEELRRLNPDLDEEWQVLIDEAQALIDAKRPPASPQAQALLKKWEALLGRTCDHDPALAEKFVHAFSKDPVLQAGSLVSAQVGGFIERARAAATRKRA